MKPKKYVQPTNAADTIFSNCKRIFLWLNIFVGREWKKKSQVENIIFLSFRPTLHSFLSLSVPHCIAFSLSPPLSLPTQRHAT